MSDETFAHKSTVEEIRARFDVDVERFSNLETGQQATIDAPLAMELIARCAAATTPHARDLLDIGCGAGNYALRLLQELPQLHVTLMDLSQPMLDRAHQRVSAATPGKVRTVQSDVRQFAFEPGQFDIVVAASVLHHLREADQWRQVFADVFAALRPGGSFWIFDLVESTTPGVREVMQARYAEYLTELEGPAYCEKVFAYIEQEDTPRPLVFQLELLREVGFAEVDVLHKSACFAAFGAVRR